MVVVESDVPEQRQQVVGEHDEDWPKGDIGQKGTLLDS